MRRFFRIAANGLMVLSLLMCVGIVVLWARSERVEDTLSASFEWGWPGQDFQISVASHKGDLLVKVDWPVSGRTGHFTRLPGDPAVQALWGYMWGDPLFDLGPLAFSYDSWDNWYVVAECWLVAVLLLAWPPGVVLARRAFARRAKRRAWSAGRCVHCGYDMRETPYRCPECGRSRTWPDN